MGGPRQHGGGRLSYRVRWQGKSVAIAAGADARNRVCRPPGANVPQAQGGCHGKYAAGRRRLLSNPPDFHPIDGL